MKISAFKCALCLLGSPACFGLVSHAADQSSVPRIEVSVESELKTLAQGFAEAFFDLPNGPKYVWVRRGGEVVALGSALSVSAHGGVLSIQIDGGPIYLVSAGDVVQITNEKAGPTRS